MFGIEQARHPQMAQPAKLLVRFHNKHRWPEHHLVLAVSLLVLKHLTWRELTVQRSDFRIPGRISLGIRQHGPNVRGRCRNLNACLDMSVRRKPDHQSRPCGDCATNEISCFHEQVITAANAAGIETGYEIGIEPKARTLTALAGPPQAKRRR